MEQHTSLRLMGELQSLAQAKRSFAQSDPVTNEVAKYHSPEHFRREQETVLRRGPQIVAHSSELPQKNSFLTRRVAGLPLLLTRDEDGEVHGFLNVCRHRGTRLVDGESGCKGRFACPYHAWTWDNRGDLQRMPFGDEGFAHLDKSELGLQRLPCVEQYGWLWLAPDGHPLDLTTELRGLGDDLHWLAGETLEIKAAHEVERRANWKLLIEGGLEAYHFRVVHRQTIGPHFPNNLSSFEAFGDHLRSVLPRAGIEALPMDPGADWFIRDHANILYSFFPISQLLVMQDHLVWIRAEPLAADLTRTVIYTLGAKDSDDDAHWKRNHAITSATLKEDGEIAESIQEVINAGANEVFHFGRFEGALTRFNDAIDRAMETPIPG